MTDESKLVSQLESINLKRLSILINKTLDNIENLTLENIKMVLDEFKHKQVIRDYIHNGYTNEILVYPTSNLSHITIEVK